MSHTQFYLERAIIENISIKSLPLTIYQSQYKKLLLLALYKNFKNDF